MLHIHAHDGPDDEHGHHHHDHGAQDHPGDPARWPRLAVRAGLGLCVLAAALLAACAVTVHQGEAVVVTQFGDPLRVITEPGLAWTLPAPIQSTLVVDRRLRSSSTGVQDVGTRDGLRILLQAYVVWQPGASPDAIRRYLRSVRDDPDEAARQLRGLVGSALQVSAASFDLADLINTDAGKLRLDAFEQRLRAQIAGPVAATYGIELREVGLERLSLPDVSLAATVGRMQSEREVIAAQRTAEGLRAAAEIRSNATRDGRIEIADAHAEAAAITAQADRAAAAIQAEAYRGDPQLYTLMRSLDSLTRVIGPNTRLILRTDAPPFSALAHLPGQSPP